MTATTHNCTVKRVVKSYYPIPDRRFEGRSVIFHTKSNQYLPSMVSDFPGFIVRMAGNEKFTMEIEGKLFTVEIGYNGYKYQAVCPNEYDGLNPVYLCSSKTKEEALFGLIEQISEKILSEQ